MAQEGGRDHAAHDFFADLELPGHGFAGAGVVKAGAAVVRQLLYGGRRAVLRDVGRRGADDELQRQDAPRDDAAPGRRAGAKADVDAVFDPVADAVVHLDVGFDLRMAAAIFFQHRPQHLEHDGARRGDAQRPGDLFAAAGARRAARACSVESPGCAACRNCSPSSVRLRLRVVRWNRRTPRWRSSCTSAWLAACGVMACAAAAWRRLPSSAALTKVAMARSSFKAMVLLPGWSDYHDLLDYEPSDSWLFST